MLKNFTLMQLTVCLHLVHYYLPITYWPSSCELHVGLLDLIMHTVPVVVVVVVAVAAAAVFSAHKKHTGSISIGICERIEKKKKKN